MELLRLTDISVIYFLKNLLYTKGFQASKYDIIDSFPNDTSKINIFPTVSVEAQLSKEFPFEIGHESLLQVSFTLDIFANGDGQADDIAYIIWKELSLTNQPVYDFNVVFPPNTLPVDYTGIPKIANMSFNRQSIINVSPPIFTEITAERYHRMVLFNANVIN